jgi:hypothetical protein
MAATRCCMAAVYFSDCANVDTTNSKAIKTKEIFFIVINFCGDELFMLILF